MEINDIISHKWSALEFYDRLAPTTIQLASKEPLKISDLCRQDIKPRAPKQPIPTGKVVTYGGALCYYCIQSLLSEYNRTNKPDKYGIEKIAKKMVREFAHWTVADLPTFESMCIGARLPSMKWGVLEYELLNLDNPSIIGKLEAYNQMRPNPQALQGGSPEKATEKPLEDWHKTHLVDGTDYIWTDMEACKRYWRGAPDKDDPHFKANQASLTAKTSKPIVRTVNDILKSRDFGGTSETGNA